jgi:hypothetical protein
LSPLAYFDKILCMRYCYVTQNVHTLKSANLFQTFLELANIDEIQGK